MTEKGLTPDAGRPVEQIHKPIMVYPVSGLEILATATLELPPIFTEFGRSMPDPSAAPHDAAAAANSDLIAPSKNFELRISTNAFAGYSLTIQVEESLTRTGTRIITHSWTTTVEHVIKIFTVTNNLVFISLTNNHAVTDITGATNQLKLISRPD